jgi:hypothetical protein
LGQYIAAQRKLVTNDDGRILHSVDDLRWYRFSVVHPCVRKFWFTKRNFERVTFQKNYVLYASIGHGKLKMFVSIVRFYIRVDVRV